MSKILYIITFVISLTACGGKQLIKTEYKDHYIPVYSVPMPPETKRPSLALHSATQERKNNVGEYSKLLTISVAQLSGYAKELETIVNKYREVATATSTDSKDLNSLTVREWTTLINESNKKIKNEYKD